MASIGWSNILVSETWELIKKQPSGNSLICGLWFKGHISPRTFGPMTRRTEEPGVLNHWALSSGFPVERKLNKNPRGAENKLLLSFSMTVFPLISGLIFHTKKKKIHLNHCRNLKAGNVISVHSYMCKSRCFQSCSVLIICTAVIAPP